MQNKTVEELTKEVKAEEKAVEEKAFQLYSKAMIRYRVRRIAEANEQLDNHVVALDALTEANLRQLFDDNVQVDYDGRYDRKDVINKNHLISKLREEY